MRLREKESGKLIETEGCIVNGPGFTMSIETFAERYEIVPEAEKPFEEVAKASFSVICSGANDKDKVAYGKGMIKIADRDYYEILPDGTKKTEFTWDEAMEIEKKTNGKWRLPTAAEWAAIVATFGCDGEGNFDGGLFAKRLNLTTDGDGYGYFWSSTASSTTGARALAFTASNIYPQSNYNKVYGFTVRCVVAP